MFRGAVFSELRNFVELRFVCLRVVVVNIGSAGGGSGGGGGGGSQ